jgi:hypothetical protein
MAQNHQFVRAPSASFSRLRPVFLNSRLQEASSRKLSPNPCRVGMTQGCCPEPSRHQRRSRFVASEKRLRQSEIPTDAAAHPTTTIEAVPCNALTVSKVEGNSRSVAQTAGFLGAAINPPPHRESSLTPTVPFAVRAAITAIRTKIVALLGFEPIC